MTTAKNRHQQLVEHFVLPDDDFAHFFEQPAIGRAQMLDGREIRLRRIPVELPLSFMA